MSKPFKNASLQNFLEPDCGGTNAVTKFAGQLRDKTSLNASNRPELRIRPGEAQESLTTYIPQFNSY